VLFLCSLHEDLKAVLAIAVTAQKWAFRVCSGRFIHRQFVQFVQRCVQCRCEGSTTAPTTCEFVQFVQFVQGKHSVFDYSYFFLETVRSLKLSDFRSIIVLVFLHMIGMYVVLTRPGRRRAPKANNDLFSNEASDNVDFFLF
jgi:hypothetical protein